MNHVAAVRDAICNLVVDSIDSGPGEGVLQFQTADFVPVATLMFSNPAFGDAGAAGGNADGVAVANAISTDKSALGGEIARAVVKDALGVDKLVLSISGMDGGGDIELSQTKVMPGQKVSLSTLTYEACP